MRLFLLALVISPLAFANIQAGVAQIDVTPTWFPVIVNCFMLERQTSEVTSRVYAKAIVLQQGVTKTAIVVVDSCMMPRDLMDEAKSIAEKATGIPANRQLISATHTHMAPAAMGCLGSDADARYAKWLPAKIAEAIIAANSRLQPALLGSTSIQDTEHTFGRRFIYRPDKMLTDPFGNKTVRANMHPGYTNQDAIGPSGPTDHTLTLLSIQSKSGKPIALLANYSMHYFNSKPISSDYFGVFATQFQQRISAPPDYVTILSQGTSGDLMFMDYSKPQQKDLTIETYTQGLVDSAEKAYKTISYKASAKLNMLETEQTFNRRRPSAERLEWANQMLKTMGDRKPKNQPEVYAREQLMIEAQPTRTLKLQAIQIGDLAIAAWPNEVFAISGLKLRKRSPFPQLMNIELANGAEGYIPPPEQHDLGGYTTWPARTAGLEVQAEPQIVKALSHLLNQLDPKRKPPVQTQTKNYWPLDDLEPNKDLVIDGLHAFAVPGRTGTTSKALYLAGASLTLNKPAKTYKLDFWILPVLTTRKWTHITIEQTATTRRTLTDGQLTSETKPTTSIKLLDNFEGAVADLRLVF